MATDVTINEVDLSGYNPAERGLLEQVLEAIQGIGDRDEVCDICQRDWTTVTRFLRGKPQGDTTAVFRDLARLVDRMDLALVRTPIVNGYWQVLESVRRKGGMGVIVARNGRAKSLTMRTFRREHAANCVLVQVPSEWTVQDLAWLLADALGIEDDPARPMKHPTRRRKLFGAVNSRHTLLIDEAGYLCANPDRVAGVRLLQDLHDQCHCGVVMVMRPHEWQTLQHHRRAADNEQFLGRILHRCIVARASEVDPKTEKVIEYPDSYKLAEVEAIMAPFCGVMDDATRAVVRSLLAREVGGLRALVHDARMAQRFAVDTGAPFAEALAAMTARRDSSLSLMRQKDF